jgi:glycosyltransferase involved in cell wall biosynthesis
MSHPLVSVIILAYKQPVFLNAALASVSAQTHPHIEILVVDDASGPEFTSQYRLPPNARLLVNEKNTATAAINRNRAIRESRGEFLAFLDQDDLWLPEKLAAQLAAFAQNSAALMHFTHYTRVDPAGIPLATQNPFGGTSGDLLKNLIRRKTAHIVCCSSVMFRKSAPNSVGLFDESIRLSADWDMWLRCAACRPNAVLADPRPLTLYREHPHQWSKFTAAGSVAAAKVMEKALTWLPGMRPDLVGLAKRRHARLLRDAGEAHLLMENSSSQAVAFLQQSAKIWPLDLNTHRLLWRARRAAMASE